MKHRLAYAAVFVVALLLGWRASAGWEHEIALRSALAALAAVLSVGVWDSAARPGRGLRVASSAALVALCGVTLGWLLVRPLAQLPSEDALQTWSTFHYFVGAKYFPELGYTGLYEQALAADADGAREWLKIDRLRDLETYAVERRGDLARSERWSDARWRELQADLEFLEPLVPRGTWAKIFRDRGYNAPPPSTALRRLLTAPEIGVASLSAVAYLDIGLLLAAFVAVGTVFGPLRALLALTWVALFFGNLGDRLIGQPLLYDYLSALLFAVCALRTGRSALAGALLAYAAAVRVFPLLLIGGLAWWVVLERRRSGGTPRSALRFGLGFAAGLAVLGLVGLGNGRGVEGYREFAANVALHADYHVSGSRRLGASHLFTVDWSQPPVGEQRVAERREIWAGRHMPSRLLAVAVGVLWLWATARRRLDLTDSVIAALVLVFFAVVLSRYYWSAACLLMLVGGRSRDGPVGSRGAAWISAALFAWTAVVYFFFLHHDSSLGRYLFANAVATLLIVGGLAVTVYGARFGARLGRASGPL